MKFTFEAVIGKTVASITCDAGTTITLPSKGTDGKKLDDGNQKFIDWKDGSGKLYSGGLSYLVTESVTFTAYYADAKQRMNVTLEGHDAAKKTIPAEKGKPFTMPDADQYQLNGENILSWIIKGDDETNPCNVYKAGEKITLGTDDLTLVPYKTAPAPVPPVNVTVHFIPQGIRVDNVTPPNKVDGKTDTQTITLTDPFGTATWKEIQDLSLAQDSSFTPALDGYVFDYWQVRYDTGSGIVASNPSLMGRTPTELLPVSEIWLYGITRKLPIINFTDSGIIRPNSGLADFYPSTSTTHKPGTETWQDLLDRVFPDLANKIPGHQLVSLTLHDGTTVIDAADCAATKVPGKYSETHNITLNFVPTGNVTVHFVPQGIRDVANSVTVPNKLNGRTGTQTITLPYGTASWKDIQDHAHAQASMFTPGLSNYLFSHWQVRYPTNAGTDAKDRLLNFKPADTIAYNEIWLYGIVLEKGSADISGYDLTLKETFTIEPPTVETIPGQTWDSITGSVTIPEPYASHYDLVGWKLNGVSINPAVDKITRDNKNYPLVAEYQVKAGHIRILVDLDGGSAPAGVAILTDYWVTDGVDSWKDKVLDVLNPLTPEGPGLISFKGWWLVNAKNGDPGQGKPMKDINLLTDANTIMISTKNLYMVDKATSTIKIIAIYNQDNTDLTVKLWTGITPADNRTKTFTGGQNWGNVLDWLNNDCSDLVRAGYRLGGWMAGTSAAGGPREELKTGATILGENLNLTKLNHTVIPFGCRMLLSSSKVITQQASRPSLWALTPAASKPPITRLRSGVRQKMISPPLP